MTEDRVLPKVTLEEVEANRKRQKEERERTAREGREEVEKGIAKRNWIADGGTEAEFESQWPQIRDEARRQRAAEKHHLRAGQAHRGAGGGRPGEGAGEDQGRRKKRTLPQMLYPPWWE